MSLSSFFLNSSIVSAADPGPSHAGLSRDTQTALSQPPSPVNPGVNQSHYSLIYTQIQALIGHRGGSETGCFLVIFSAFGALIILKKRRYIHTTFSGLSAVKS